MSQKTKRDRHILELMLIIVTVALTCLVYKTEGGKIVTLNLFYLPIVLGGFFLGRYLTGILAVFCVMTTSMVCRCSSRILRALFRLWLSDWG